MCQASLETATWVISAVVAMPPSTGEAGSWPGRSLLRRSGRRTSGRSFASPAQRPGPHPGPRGSPHRSDGARRRSRGRPWSRARSPPRTAADAWEVRRCCAPPAGEADPPCAQLRPHHWPPVAEGGPDGQIVEIERELIEVDYRRPLRSCPEEEILQGPHDRPQALVFRIQRPHHRNQTSRVGGHILRADRHAPKLPDQGPFHHPDQSDHPTRSGLRTGRGETLVQSRPSTSIENCAAVNRTTPPWIGGQVKRPSSSRLVASIRPVPSKARIFTRSARLDRKTKIVPA